MLLRVIRPFLALLSFLKAIPAQCLQQLRPSSKTWNGTILPSTRQFLAAGKSGVVYGIDAERVLKEFHDEEGGKIERRVYQRLSSHPHIAKVLDIRTDGSIVLERGTPLREICRADYATDIPILTKVHWLKHAAEGYQYLHDKDVIHSDVGCHNLILTGKDHVKLIDFEGCSVDGEPAGSCYEWFSYCPSTPRVSRQTDIFAFGCAIFEVSTGRPPYHGLETSDDPYKQVEDLYANHCFPDLTNIPLGQLIRDCWCGDIKSMSEVVQGLEAVRTESPNALR